MNGLYNIFIVIIAIVVIVVVVELLRYITINRNINIIDEQYETLPRVNSSNMIVISLTTIPERINLIKPTLISLLTQSHRVDEIAINIPYISRKGVEYIIPDWLTSLENVIVYRTNKDWGPATKLIPTLQREENDTRIIVVDDDIIYHSKTVSRLVEAFETENGNNAVTTFGFTIKDCNGNYFFDSRLYRIQSIFGKRRKVDLLLGVAGFIVTPNMFPKEVFNQHILPIEALTVDDIVFSAWLSYNNVDIYALGSYQRNISLPYNFDTPSLMNTENANSIRDKYVIEWFNNNYNVLI